MSKRPWIAIAIGVGMLLTGWLVFAPVYDGPYKRQHANDAATVGTIRTINLLQITYASKNGRFTCSLAELSAIADKDEHLQFSEKGERVGHVFVLRGCDSGLRNEKYQIVVAPTEPGVTGFKTYCSDETGMIYYDEDGPGERCFQRKNPIT